jgi:hypothetical protein
MGQIQNILVGVLLFSLIGAGLSILAVELSQNSPSTATVNATALNSTLPLNNIYSIQNRSSSIIQNSTPPVGQIIFIFSEAYNILKLFQEVFYTIPNVMISNLVIWLGLPSWVILPLEMIMGIVVLFAILAIFLRPSGVTM